ncbi:MAG: glycosyltransferase [Nocardioides sp.]
MSPTSRLLVASDVRVLRGPDGVAYATHPAGEYDAFAPLRGLRRRVTVISRDAASDRASRSGQRSSGAMTGPGVEHVGVPDYDSWGSLVRGLPSTAAVVWRSLGQHDAVWVRVPEPLSLVVGLLARLRGRPVIANVVADPASLVVRGASRSATRLLVLMSRMVLRRSSGVVYVTSQHLQRQYPAPPGVATLVRSNVRLAGVRSEARSAPPAPRLRILTVGTNTGLSKGQDLVLELVRALADRGLDVTADLVGGGDRTDWLETRAAQLGIADRCRIRGHVSDPDELRSAYDEADVFCLPSRSEGLPRAVVEALAVGLPAVGSAAGGIPELLDAAQVVATPTADRLAAAVLALVEEPGAYERASRAALVTADRICLSTRPEVLEQFLDRVLGQT